jgi:hypothetical protein
VRAPWLEPPWLHHIIHGAFSIPMYSFGPSLPPPIRSPFRIMVVTPAWRNETFAARYDYVSRLSSWTDRNAHGLQPEVILMSLHLMDIFCIPCQSLFSLESPWIASMKFFSRVYIVNTLFFPLSMCSHQHFANRPHASNSHALNWYIAIWSGDLCPRFTFKTLCIDRVWLLYSCEFVLGCASVVLPRSDFTAWWPSRNIL